MSRREIVVLVSRAIAILQIISALIELTLGLPQQFVIMILPVLNARSLYPGVNPRTSDMLMNIRWTSMGFLLAHVAALLLIGVLFWNCGPTVEGWLLPAGNSTEESSQSA